MCSSISVSVMYMGENSAEGSGANYHSPKHKLLPVLIWNTVESTNITSSEPVML